MTEKKARYVKLGEKAREGSFYDPFLDLKLLPGRLVELPSDFRKSKKTVAALRGGHLEYVDSEEVTAYFKDLEVNLDEDDEEGITEAQLKKYNKAQLTDYIQANSEEEDEDELAELSKAELLALALELYNQE